MAPQAEGSLATLRDRKLLLLGFAGAFRRSELVTLNVDDIEEVADGLRVTIRRGKIDQEARGAAIAIVRGGIARPVSALRAWLEAARTTKVRSSVGSAAAITCRQCELHRPIGRQHRQDARETCRLGPAILRHSLRSGFLTSAACRGATLSKMMATSRHRSVETVTGYVRDQERFKAHAGAGLL